MKSCTQYPIIVIDDFLDDPDYVRDLALSVDYDPDTGGYYPGKRSDFIHNIDNRLFLHLGQKLFSIFGSPPDSWVIEMQFQKTPPQFPEDEFDIRNRGWAHRDCPRTYFGGVIYLNKNPDPNTGTNIYKCKNGFVQYLPNEGEIKRRFYKTTINGKSNDLLLDYDEYKKEYDKFHEQLTVSLKVDNYYNRLVLFGGETPHGANSFGKEDRYTLVFFATDVGSGQSFDGHPPLCRI